MTHERLTHSTARNWVDRGQPPEPELGRVLSGYLDLDPERPVEPRLQPHVEVIRRLVEADADEVQLADYLKTVERNFGVTGSNARPRWAAAIALWHIAKCAQVRERAQLPVAHSSPTPPPAARTSAGSAAGPPAAPARTRGPPA